MPVIPEFFYSGIHIPEIQLNNFEFPTFVDSRLRGSDIITMFFGSESLQSSTDIETMSDYLNN